MLGRPPPLWSAWLVFVLGCEGVLGCMIVLLRRERETRVLLLAFFVHTRAPVIVLSSRRFSLPSSHMASSTVKTRLVADPAIGVGDFEKIWDEFIEETPGVDQKGNIFEFLRPPPNFNRRSAPSPIHLSRISKLLVKYVSLAPNGVIPGKKHKTALKGLDNKRSLNKTRKSQDDFTDCLDDWIRVALGHYREMAQSDEKKGRCFRRADRTQQSEMEEVISMMNVVPGEIAEDDESGLALVPLPPPAESPPDSNPPSWPPSRAQSSSSILSVDATEKALDPAEFFAAYLGEDAKASAVQVHEKPRKPATPQVSKPTDLFLVGLMQSKELGGEELAILKDVQEKPVDKKKPPPKAKAKSGKGKGKGKSVATPEVAKAAAVKKNSVKEAQKTRLQSRRRLWAKRRRMM